MTPSISCGSLTDRTRGGGKLAVAALASKKTAFHSHSICALVVSLVSFGCGSKPDARVNEARTQVVVARGQPSGDTITRWNSNAIAILSLSPANPLDLTRGLAMTHLAMHDAANAVRPRYAAYAYRTSDDTGADPELASAVAAYDVLLALRPAKKDQLDGFLSIDLSAVDNEHRRENSLTVGAAAADAILGSRVDDGSAAVGSYTPGTAPGDYRYTPPFSSVLAPQWRSVKPFALASPDQFRPPGPTSLGSAEYARDYNEVKDYGAAASTVRTAAQTEEAKFWLTVPALISNRVARDLAHDQGLDLWETARTFALIQMAFADALIATWDAKFKYGFWRPYTAIRAGDTDGNDATVVDSTWTPLNTTPPFPEYPSAHAVVTAASGVILNDTFGANTTFTATSESLSGVTHTYASFDELTRMSTESRIWGGFHFRTSCVHGKDLGDAVGHWVLNHYLSHLAD